MNEPSESPALRSSNRGLPELLLPAGGFDAAIAAFDGGGDAVYLGLRDFSARKQARNFDDLEYRRILRLARDRGKRIYVAMNTIVTDAELPAAAERLAFLSRFAPDALIFQDWGLARLARRNFPEIPLHASTQTAIQTDAAVTFAREAGATRVVLPRETSLLELAERVAANPGVEFEIFVHGALCYSYSGLCLASGLELGRSGNRGECAQLCRSWYAGSGGLKGEGYWFSCRDLDLSERLGDIVEAGAASLKVEGRMKSPEYVHAVAKLYRAALDRLAEMPEGPDAAADSGGDRGSDASLRENARVAFARAPTSGWIGHHGGASIIDPAFPGHRGVGLGRIVGTKDGELVLELETSLGMRDGIQAVGEALEGGRSPSCQFSVLDMRDAESGKRIFEAARGMKVLVPAPELGATEPTLLGPGRHIEKISSRDLDRKKESPEEYPPLQSIIALKLLFEDLSNGEARASLVLEDQATGMDSNNSAQFLAVDVPLKVERARQQGGIFKALDVFAESGTYDFVFRLPEGSDAIRFGKGYRGPEAEWLFIPPSNLKRFKNAAYELVAGFLADRSRTAAARSVTEAVVFVKDYVFSPVPRPPRAEIVFADARIEGGMPFATPSILESGVALPELGGWRFLPLAPLVLSTEAYLEMARKRIGEELAAGSSLAIGLDAPHHCAFARSLIQDPTLSAHLSRLAFWIDIHLYVANASSLAFLGSTLDRIAFAYRWIEAEKAGLTAPDSMAIGDMRCPPLVEVGEGFNAPLFLSKACLIRQHLGKGHCPVPCGKRMAAPLRDRDKAYIAIVEDCVSMLFRRSMP